MAKSIKPPTKGKAKKSTHAEFNRRISIVAEMVLRGHSRAEIVRYSAENWKVNSRQVDTYLAKADEQISEESKALVINASQKSISRKHKLYAIAIKGQDYNLALKIQESMDKQLGLNEPEKHDINIKGSIPIEKWIEESK